MECARIKSLLSEYMDKIVESETAREIKEHLLICKDCSSDYFRMKSVADEMKSMERYRAPSNLLNRVNLAIQKRPWYMKLIDFLPGSGGFKFPVEYLTFSATAVLVFFIFISIYTDKVNNIMPGAGTSSKLAGSNTLNKTVELEFIPVESKGSDKLNSDRLFSVSSGKSSRDIEIPDILKMMDMGDPSAKNDKLISHMKEIILAAEGDIVSKEHQGNPEHIDAITVSIPSKNYDIFVKQVEEMGRFHPAAPPLADKRDEFILMRIKFNLSE